MRILAIETSCDETALAVLKITGKKFTIEAHQVASQIELHTKYGGVFPMMAKREHARNIVPLYIETLKEARLLRHRMSQFTETSDVSVKKIKTLLSREQDIIEPLLELVSHYKKPAIDKIVVTVGPGLEPALWVGINFAKALSLAWDIPLAPVNHMEGHVLSVLVPKDGTNFKISNLDFKLPALSLLVSGGHTELVLMNKIGKYKLVGQTRDDAAGEAFDKVARMLELPYPGGPYISKLAAQARKENMSRSFKLPRPMIGSKDFDFSFSGLKTAVLYHIRDLRASGVQGTPLTEKMKLEIAREFEDAAVDVLVSKTIAAAKKFKSKSIIVGGGVSANNELSKRLTEKAKSENIEAHFPVKNLTTDNAIMIAIAGYFSKPVPTTSKKLIARGNLSF